MAEGKNMKLIKLGKILDLKEKKIIFEEFHYKSGVDFGYFIFSKI